MKEKTITFQESTVFYRTTGTGKTIVLVHGFCEDGSIWDRQVDFLKDYFCLIIPDLPGSGQSELVKNANIETYAEAIKHIVDTELEGAGDSGETGHVILIGHSLGGYITLAFAEKYPQYLDAFGLFHSSAFADDEEKKESREKAIRVINNKGVTAFLKTLIPGLFTKDFAEANPGIIDDLLKKGENFTSEALVQYLNAMIARPDRTSILKEFPNPILFIIGEHDTAIPLEISLRQCYLPLVSHVNILANSAHMAMIEETEKSNEFLMKFLQ